MVYGLSSTGMTVNFHYCCGNLKKVEFSSTEVECGMKMQHSSSKKCCDNKLIELKVKADQKITEGVKATDKVVAVANLFYDFSFASPVYGKKLIPSIFTPPPLAGHPLYVLHCIYRI